MGNALCTFVCILIKRGGLVSIVVSHTLGELRGLAVAGCRRPSLWQLMPVVR